MVSAQEDSLTVIKRVDTTASPLKIKNKPRQNADLVVLKEITIKDYKIISHARDTTFLDTTLTIEKEYKYNYLRKDDFELMPFANVGQPYNKLGVDFERETFYPLLGARARNINYMEISDILYYNVPTPMTDLFFKTTFEQGQLLDALLTFNTSPRLNFSIAYKGFRSLGKYQFEQIESGNFRATGNYVTENGRYELRAHIAAQDIDGEENGGLTNKELQFESGDSEFKDRSRIDVELVDADNKIVGKRYYFDHRYNFLSTNKADNSKRNTTLKMGHKFNYETKYYQFNQGAQNDYFGSSFVTPIDDRARLKTFLNELSVSFSNPTLGVLKGTLSLYNYDYYFNSILITDTKQIPNRLEGEEISFGAVYDKNIGKFTIHGDVAYNLSGKLTGNKIDAFAGYSFNKDNKVTLSIHSSSRLPNFNFLLYQSDYENYNWHNSEVFENENVSLLQLNLDTKFLGSFSAKITRLDNYSYFTSVATDEQIASGQENAFVRPMQEQSTVEHFKLKYNKEFKLGKWALNNTLMYQNVSQSNEVLNVPQLVTRNTLYYSSDVFKKAMFIQAGITFKYFTEYNMDSYNPLLGEFYIQNGEQFGGYPLLDFFINAKIRQTRIYLKAEHFNSSFSGYNFYSAPRYPYRDFVIRFGLVWNFFS